MNDPPTNVIPDFFQLKYPPAQRAEFLVSSSMPVAIFVLATGVQLRTDSGWRLYSEEPRNDIWRLKPGELLTICLWRFRKKRRSRYGEPRFAIALSRVAVAAPARCVARPSKNKAAERMTPKEGANR